MGHKISIAFLFAFVVNEVKLSNTCSQEILIKKPSRCKQALATVLICRATTRRLVLFLFLGAIFEYSPIAVLVYEFWGFGGTGWGWALLVAAH